MSNAWIVDILKDIRDFAKNNGMLELSEHLDDAIFITVSAIKENYLIKMEIKKCITKKIEHFKTEKDGEN